MEILHINDHKVKLTLTQKEIDRLSLSGRRVEEWGDVRATLSQILKGSTLSPDFLKGRILVQAYPMCDGGCELFITRLCEVEKESAETSQHSSKRTSRQTKPRHRADIRTPDATDDEAKNERDGGAAPSFHTPATTQKNEDAPSYRRVTSVFRFATREDLKEAAHLFGASMRGSEIFRIEGDRYVLVTDLRAFGNASQETGIRMHPLCEFAEPLPIGVLDCLSEHGCRVSLDAIVAD